MKEVDWVLCEFVCRRILSIALWTGDEVVIDPRRRLKSTDTAMLNEFMEEPQQQCGE